MKEKKGLSRKAVVLLVSLSILFLVVLLVAFLFFFYNQKEQKEKTFNSGAVLMTYSNKINSLSISNVQPISDTVGVSLSEANQYFDFSVATTLEDSKKIVYEIVATKDSKNSDILDSDVRIYLEKQDSGTFIKVFEPKKFVSVKRGANLNVPVGSMVLGKFSSKEDAVDNYRLRIWLSDEAKTVYNETNNYTININVYGEAK